MRIAEIAEMSMVSRHNTPQSPNRVSNAKYTPLTLVPRVLYSQFHLFVNLYFLLVALSQAFPPLRIGYLSSYIVPLAFVLTITIFKEVVDEYHRTQRDKLLNEQIYTLALSNAPIMAQDLNVGDIVTLAKGMRVPADMILLKSSENTGEAFIKTDQLDGETDWKLRIAPNITQSLDISSLSQAVINFSEPNKDIHSFVGNLTINGQTSPLNVDNTLWANTVVASGGCIAIVAYVGASTKQALNTSQPKVKTALLELEINDLSKLLCISVFVLSILLVVLQGFSNDWYLDILRFLILFSTIIPVSLRVNLDLAKSVYAHQIQHDTSIPDTIVRTSTIPEDLGRIEYLLTDKTGTLTQNEMLMKKLHLGSVSYANDSLDLMKDYISQFGSQSFKRRDLGQKVRELVLTLALCHNVTPTYDNGQLDYQAASPDEVAIVKFTSSVGLTLIKRDRNNITLLHNETNQQFVYDILQVFPFNSDTKRMGIIVRDSKGEVWFLLKGADTVMSKLVSYNDWLEEETGNMAREGLRTLVIGRKKLSEAQLDEFNLKYHEASVSMTGRDVLMQRVIGRYLEVDLQLCGITGVEDKLQQNVKSSIESLRNAGIKIWMLTGDKVETARCIGVSAKLISRGQYVHTIERLNSREIALNKINYLKSNRDACLLIDGESLAIYLTHFPKEFLDIVVNLPTVIACRCTPQQKADVAILIRELTQKRVCCIGDGGNDVSMIQAADVGLGIVGKEGKQASLAADYSIMQFSYVTNLLLWHGRNSYKRSAKLSQFVIHRGLIMSVCQAVYSISSHFEPLALYQGWLMVGYATLYTMMPVFSLTLDCDVDEHLVTLYPELYHDLTRGVALSYKTFFIWVGISIYQGIIIQLLAQYWEGLSEFTTMVALSFTALIVNELLMVAIEVNKWTKAMVYCQVITLIFYFGSVPLLGEYFNLDSLRFWFWVKCVLVVAISVGPVWLFKIIGKTLRPPAYAKVQQA